MSLLQTCTDMLHECQTLGWGSSYKPRMLAPPHTPSLGEREREMSDQRFEKCMVSDGGHIGHCGNTEEASEKAPWRKDLLSRKVRGFSRGNRGLRFLHVCFPSCSWGIFIIDPKNPTEGISLTKCQLGI